jgi:hypothetical protein
MVREGIPDIIQQEGSAFQYSPHSGSGGTCTYVWEGEPDCLIGRYLVDLGLPIEAFLGHEGKGVDDLFLDGHLKKYEFSAEPEAILAMKNIQDLQDNELTWGEAYENTFNPEN